MTKLVRKHNPQLLFLIETKRKSAEMEWLRSRWHFDCCLAVDYVGRGGGLALLWMNRAMVQIRSYSCMHIDANIGDVNMGETWRFTGFYGSPEVSQRTMSWDLLLQIHSQSTMPWLFVGDFNEITCDAEKLGRALRPIR